ncbi:MAG TPA: sigma-70 family RNA polymerase sigma factor [Vicinamibacterales bacterium]|nr:sigma-70 family RNA polymerase sigma factor [Vicinamibacterales bacterium]
MARGGAKDVTALLVEVRNGRKEAMDDLMAVVYPELRQIAGHYLRSERPDHTLQTTALVHEVYLRIFGAARTDWKNRAYFFAAVARDMRRILVDYARSRNAKKRLGTRVMLSLADVKDLGARRDEDLAAVDEALTRLERLAPRASRVVELRFFTGLNERETAEVLHISVSTLKRDWQFAKAWLFNELRSRDV